MKPGSEKYNTAAAVLDRAKVEAYKHVPRVLEYERAEDLPDEFTPEDELIEGLIGRAALSVLYGDSNSGKTFLAVDIACAVARGAAWMGRNVERGMVVYLATEAPASVRKRLQAYQHHHGCRVPDFFVVKSPLNLFDTEADATAVIKLVKQLESDHGAKCELVVGDTLARLSAGANENVSTSV
nr:AAA family ATPase [uncultured Caldimonas sp.]